MIGFVVGLGVGLVGGGFIKSAIRKRQEERKRRMSEVAATVKVRYPGSQKMFQDHEFENDMVRHEQKKKEEEKKKHDEWNRKEMPHIFAPADMNAFVPDLQVASAPITHSRSHSSHHDSGGSSSSHSSSSHDSYSSHSSYDSHSHSSVDSGSHHW